MKSDVCLAVLQLQKLLFDAEDPWKDMCNGSLAAVMDLPPESSVSVEELSAALCKVNTTKVSEQIMQFTGVSKLLEQVRVSLGRAAESRAAFMSQHAVVVLVVVVVVVVCHCRRNNSALSRGLDADNRPYLQRF